MTRSGNGKGFGTVSYRLTWQDMGGRRERSNPAALRGPCPELPRLIYRAALNPSVTGDGGPHRRIERAVHKGTYSRNPGEMQATHCAGLRPLLPKPSISPIPLGVGPE